MWSSAPQPRALCVRVRPRARRVLEAPLCGPCPAVWTGERMEARARVLLPQIMSEKKKLPDSHEKNKKIKQKNKKNPPLGKFVHEFLSIILLELPADKNPSELRVRAQQLQFKFFENDAPPKK